MSPSTATPGRGALPIWIALACAVVLFCGCTRDVMVRQAGTPPAAKPAPTGLGRTVGPQDGAHELNTVVSAAPDSPDAGPALHTAQHPLDRTARQLDGEEEESAEEREREATHAKEAMEFRRMQRLDDNGQIDPTALIRAKEWSDQMRELEIDGPVQRDAGIWDWEWLGPTNIGGRIRAVCFGNSASTIYIGGVGGGIWVSFDTGASWIAATDFIASLAVTSIVRDPTNANVLYAATGEGFGNTDALPGAGVFKSTDAGFNWVQLPATAGWTYTNRLAHHPTVANTLFAATDTGVQKSTDGGGNWTLVLNVNALDVKVNPLDPNQVLVGTGSSVYLSLLGGGPGQWTLQTTGAANKLPAFTGRCEVAFGSGSRQWVSMNRNGGELWRSTDNGTTWTPRNTGMNYFHVYSDPNYPSQGWYDNALWASPDDPNLVVVGGIDAWRSTDGGAALTQISTWPNYHNGGPANSAHADHHMIIQPPGYGASNRNVYFANDGGIQRAANIYTVAQTSGWTNLANNLGVTQFYNGAAHPSGSHIIGGAQDNDTLRFRAVDGGAWFQAETGDGGAVAIHQTDPNIMYGEFVYLKIEKSTNAGSSWFDAISGLTDAGDPNKALFIAPFSLDMNNNNILVAGGISVWRTTNAGGTWTSIRGALTGKVSAIDIAQGNSNNIWAGYNNGRVSRTTVNVNTWTDVDTNGATPLPNRYVTDIAINPTDPNEVFVTFGGYSADSVWRTTDNGANWIQRTGSGADALPAVQVNTIRFHPLNTNWIYVGTDLGVYASEDKGATWSRTPRYGGVDHEGPVNTEVSELFWQGTSYLVAATHGRGMYRVRPMVVVYANSTASGFQDGTFAFPYRTVYQSEIAAGHGTTISLQAGTYDEVNPLSLFKRGRVVATGGVARIR